MQFLAKFPRYCKILSILIQIRYSKYSHVLGSHAYYRIVYKYLSSLVRTWDLFRSPLYPNLCHNRASTDISDKIQAPGEKLELPDQNLAVWRRYWSRLFVWKNFDIKFSRLKNYILCI